MAKKRSELGNPAHLALATLANEGIRRFRLIQPATVGRRLALVVQRQALVVRSEAGVER